MVRVKDSGRSSMTSPRSDRPRKISGNSMLPLSDAFPGTSNEDRGEKNKWGQPLTDLRQASKLIPWQRKLPISILHSIAVIEPHPFLQIVAANESRGWHSSNRCKTLSHIRPGLLGNLLHRPRWHPIIRFNSLLHSKPRIARFLLAAHSKDKNGVDFNNVTVQSHIAVRTAPDHQFPLVVIRGAANHGIVLQHVERLDDLPDAQHRIFNLILGQVIEDAIKIIPHLRRQFDARHSQRASLRATGRFTFLPASRSSR